MAMRISQLDVKNSRNSCTLLGPSGPPGGNESQRPHPAASFRDYPCFLYI
jgi:hypothetical protein